MENEAILSDQNFPGFAGLENPLMRYLIFISLHKKMNEP
jgi:hypothetical protein